MKKISRFKSKFYLERSGFAVRGGISTVFAEVMSEPETEAD